MSRQVLGGGRHSNYPDVRVDSYSMAGACLVAWLGSVEGRAPSWLRVRVRLRIGSVRGRARKGRTNRTRTSTANVKERADVVLLRSEEDDEEGIPTCSCSHLAHCKGSQPLSLPAPAWMDGCLCQCVRARAGARRLPPARACASRSTHLGLLSKKGGRQERISLGGCMYR